MISFTCESSVFARSSSEEEEDELKSFTREARTGEKVPWRPYAGVSASEEDEDGSEVKRRWTSARKVNGMRLGSLSGEAVRFVDGNKGVIIVHC